MSQPENADLQKSVWPFRMQNLGMTYHDLGNLQQALTFLKTTTTWKKELYAAYPQNVDFKNGLAISYAKLGRNPQRLWAICNRL